MLTTQCTHKSFPRQPINLISTVLCQTKRCLNALQNRCSNWLFKYLIYNDDFLPLSRGIKVKTLWGLFHLKYLLNKQSVGFKRPFVLGSFFDPRHERHGWNEKQHESEKWRVRKIVRVIYKLFIFSFQTSHTLISEWRMFCFLGVGVQKSRKVSHI